MCFFPAKKERKMHGDENGFWRFKFPSSLWQRGGAYNNGRRYNNSPRRSPGLNLCDKSRNQQSKHRPLIFGGQGLFCPLRLSEGVCKLLQEHTNGWLPHGWKWGIDSRYGAKNWNWPKFTAVFSHVFSWKLQAFNRFQSSKVTTLDRFTSTIG